MFYEKQPKIQRDNYKRMLSLIGNLTLLFSESDCPYLPYRCHENIFCKYFEAENLGRKDCSADAKKGEIGLGLKTWTGADNQKVAEFNKLKSKLELLNGLELCKKVAEYRNDRIRVTKNMYDLNELFYHIVKRVSGTMQILEHTFDYIDIDNISIIPDKGDNNNPYFSDGKHIYHFNSSKSTLYMIFEDLVLLDSFPVEIMADPYDFLLQTRTKEEIQAEVEGVPVEIVERRNQLCLRLYTFKNKEKIVAPKSGLNQWNAGGRKRDINEIYIPYPAVDRQRTPDFFPPRDTSFNLHMPDGSVISAKVCQDEGKAIMSNPNKVLGEWLLRKVFELEPGTVLTYEMLESYGVDSVVFTKNNDGSYSINFSELGTYESFYSDAIEDEE